MKKERNTKLKKTVFKMIALLLFATTSIILLSTPQVHNFHKMYLTAFFYTVLILAPIYLGTAGSFISNSILAISITSLIITIYKTGNQNLYLIIGYNFAAFISVHLIHILNQKTQRELNHFKEDSLSDKLSSLYNRRFYDTQILNEIKRAERDKSNLSLLLIDIDDFKYINDSHGHHYGDEVIFKVGVILKQCVRSTDYVCRIGGDEFAIILPQSNAAETGRIAERIQNLLNISDVHKEDSRITLSIGGTTLVEFISPDTDELFNEADKALYQAKSNGKNSYCYSIA